MKGKVIIILDYWLLHIDTGCTIILDPSYPVPPLPPYSDRAGIGWGTSRDAMMTLDRLDRELIIQIYLLINVLTKPIVYLSIFMYYV